MTSRGTRADSGTAAASAAKRSRVGRSARLRAVETQAVEEERAHRQSCARSSSTSSLRPKRRIVIWKGCGRPAASNAIASPSRISSRGRQRAHQLDDFRHRLGDLIQRARVDAHLAPALVHLDARAVHLPLECRLAAEQLAQRLRRRRRRSARASARRGEQLEPEPAPERFGPFEQRDARDRAEARHVHGRAAHLRDGQLGRRGDRIDHDAVERALAQLAHEKPREERLLPWRRACEERPQETAAARRRARALRRGDLGERGIHLLQRQRGGGGVSRGAGILQQRVADADPPLRDRAGEKMHRGLYLVRVECAQVGGKRLHLAEARGGGGNAF